MTERWDYLWNGTTNSMKGSLSDSEVTEIRCPFCKHKFLRWRQSPFFQFGCYGDTHYHYYCGKCYEYVCKECNSKMIDGIEVFEK